VTWISAGVWSVLACVASSTLAITSLGPVNHPIRTPAEITFENESERITRRTGL